MDIRENFKPGTINKTDVYITPMVTALEVSIRGGRRFPQDCYVNTFLGDKTNPEHSSNRIMLLYRIPRQTVENVKIWNNFETYLTGLPSYITDYKVDKYHRMFVYGVPDIWKEDYKKFLEWKPSQFSKEYKEHIRYFYGNVPNNMPIMQVLNKDEQRFRELEEMIGTKIPRDLEASSVPYWGEEYYQEQYRVLTALQLKEDESRATN